MWTNFLLLALFAILSSQVNAQWSSEEHLSTTTKEPDPNAPILGYLAVEDGSALGQQEYIRFTDDFQCSDFDFNDFVQCYMEHFGFNHQGSFNFRPPQLSMDKWVIGLEVIFKFIQHHTGCDLAAQMAQPNVTACPALNGNEVEEETTTVAVETTTADYWSNRWNWNSNTQVEKGVANISESEDALDIFYTEAKSTSWYKSVGNTLKVTRDANRVYHIEINANSGNRRLMMSQKPDHRRWMRIHCYFCGAWIDIIEDCAQRVVHFSGSNTRSYSNRRNAVTGYLTLTQNSQSSDNSSAVDFDDKSDVLPGGANYTSSEEDNDTRSYYGKQAGMSNKLKLTVPFASNCHQDERIIVVEEFHRLGLEPPPEFPTTTEEPPSTTTLKMKKRRGDVLVPRGAKYNRKQWFKHSESKSEE